MSEIRNEIVKSVATTMKFMVLFGKKLNVMTEEQYDIEVSALGEKWFNGSDTYKTLTDAVTRANKYAEKCLEVYNSNATMMATLEDKVNGQEYDYVVQTSDGNLDIIGKALKSLK